MRTPVTLKIKFKSANIDQFIERYSVDVSRGGIFIRTKEPLPVGTQLKFEFQLQDAQPLISGEGTVVWIREHDPTRTGVAPGMGVRFDKLAPQSSQVLDKILTEKQRLDGAGFEGKFDAATRAVSPEQIAKGEIDNRARPGSRLQSERTPLPDPSPFGGESRPGDDLGGFGSHESTRVMLNEQAEALAQKMREHDEKAPTMPATSAPKPMAAPRVHKPTPQPVVAQRPKTIPPTTKKEEPLPSASSVVGGGSKPAPQPMAAAGGSKPPATQPTQPMAAAPPAAAHQAGGLTVTLAAPPAGKPEPAPAEQPRQVTLPYQAAIKDEPPKAEPAPPSSTAPTPVPQTEEVAPAVEAAKFAGEELEANGANGTSAEPKKTDWFSDAHEHSETGSKPVQVERRPTPAMLPAKERTSRVEPERKSSAGAWAAVVLLLAAGGGGYLYWRSTQQPAEQPIAKPAPKPTPPPVAAAPTPPPSEPTPPAPTPPPAEKPPEAKPAPAVAPKAEGLSIPVTSKPEGAVVALDGKDIGPAPTKLDGLDAGKTYSVKITLKGYKAFETKLKPKAGAQVAATLEALPKWVAIKSTPSGAAVFVDGKRMGATPTTLKAVDFEKAHKIDIKKSGFQDETREVQPGDSWQEKSDHSELALAVELVKKEASAPAEKERPAVAKKPRRPKEPKEKPAGGEAAGGAEPGEKPAGEKPSEEKPKETVEKPVEKEKPPAEKEKEKPAEDPNLKVPDWMKK